MEFSPENIIDQEFKLSYRYYSGGERFLFLFHGYGQSADIFQTFIESVKPDFTVIAIDLFFHGSSEVIQQQQNYISIAAWNGLFDKILKKHSITCFSLLSFSIGSRFIFSVMQMFQKQIERIVLIAPDGFGNNFWFRLSTSNVLCRYIFKCVLTHPPLILWPGKLLQLFGMINAYTYRFIQKSLQLKSERERIYNTWVYFRKLKIASPDFEYIIQQELIPLLFVTGESDELVAGAEIKKISNRLHVPHIELPLAHAKMIQALELEAVKQFLIADR
ncbi:MAG: alpha/beta fold hydrolase [Cytophaga sp.]|uniref:alpha/beta fold hydrolase n=1 Tax=Cytophaga sp. TaxID=29535 RepID=UPI003F7D2094